MSAMARPQAIIGGKEGVLSPPVIDYWLMGAALILLMFGLVMVASSSMYAGERIAGSPFFFVIRHTIALCIGLVGAVVLFRVPVSTWERAGPVLVFVGLVMLVLVLIPNIGKEVNNARRWIPLGVFNLQSSEFVKLFMVIYIAGYLVRRQSEVTSSLWGFAKPMILVLLTSLLIMLEPDFGTTVVLFATVLGMLFLGGVVLWQFTILLTSSALAGGALIYFSDYRWRRITAFINPWDDQRDSDYQLVQALIAFGRGEVTGVGLGNGIQKQFYLPEAHTDFIMAVIGEEFGLIGTLGVIFLFAFITWRAFQIGTRAMAREKRFSAYTAYGFGIWIGLQSFINIGVNVGLLPTKGLTLPFISYGGNSIIVTCLVIAVLLRIDHELRQQSDGVKPGGRSWSRV
ncbi:putative lipid II flippase FtsW [endosymbiont of Lamellibrachia barhami]|uniref:putative lipid II flippase FtsW n=1 Tax=endosymbiont of Lamellibrachia barhami TaxID=205975 RepID=UPI0015A98DBF